MLAGGPPGVMTTVLVTGGAGFIGSHVCLALISAGFAPVVVDNLCNAKRSVLPRLRARAGWDIPFYEVDIRDGAALERVFAAVQPVAVLHFAGLKAVGESLTQPGRYYDNNVHGSLQLLGAMANAGCDTLVFSSSATIYGEPSELPLRETARTGPTNPYGRSKKMVEDILEDHYAASPDRWRIARMRYFNPVGADCSGTLGEDPGDAPNNLVPLVCRAAAGLIPELVVFGGDYPTPDGTGVRDYIHVSDLADGHVAALRALQRGPGLSTVNLGTGRGYSVLEVIRTFERETGVRVPYRVASRRGGDVALCWADATAMREWTGWQARRDLAEMLRDAWRWQCWARDNPGLTQ